MQWFWLLDWWLRGRFGTVEAGKCFAWLQGLWLKWCGMCLSWLPDIRFEFEGCWCMKNPAWVALEIRRGTVPFVASLAPVCGISERICLERKPEHLYPYGLRWTAPTFWTLERYFWLTVFSYSWGGLPQYEPWNDFAPDRLNSERFAESRRDCPRLTKLWMPRSGWTLKRFLKSTWLPQTNCFWRDSSDLDAIAPVWLNSEEVSQHDCPWLVTPYHNLLGKLLLNRVPQQHECLIWLSSRVLRLLNLTWLSSLTDFHYVSFFDVRQMYASRKLFILRMIILMQHTC